MSVIVLDRGYVVTGSVVNLATAAVANAKLVYAVSAYASQIGTKSFIVKKIRMMNNAAGNQTVIIGTGAAGTFVQKLPGLNTLNNLETVWEEIDLPRVEFFLSMTAYPVALVAGGSIDVIVEVEEIG